MPRALYLFEDEQVSNLAPIVAMRPVFDLRLGILTLGQKIQAYFPDAPCGLWCRPVLADLVRAQNPDVPVNIPPDGVALYVNGRVVMDDELASHLSLDGPDCLYFLGDTRTIVAARLHRSQWPLILEDTHAGGVLRATIEQTHVAARMINYPWDLIRYNTEAIFHDFPLNIVPFDPRRYSGIHALNTESIIVGPETMIYPGVVLDATEGPILIGRRVRILPHAYLQGPLSIGDDTLVKAGARLYHGTTIGPVCKVGGEIEASIIQGYSNKQHDGFLGHSYLGEWVNLGAGTTTSNLKNTYGMVTAEINRTHVETGMQFLGLMMGDYTKSGIHTMFNTGTIVGFSSNVVSNGFPPQWIPSFCWHTSDAITGYRLQKALEVAQHAMDRRNRTMSPAAISRFVGVYGETLHERQAMGS